MVNGQIIRHVKLGLTGEISTRGYQYVEIPETSKHPSYCFAADGTLDVIKYKAIEYYCTKTGEKFPSDSQSYKYNVSLEFYDKDGDVVAVDTVSDFRILYSYMPPNCFIKVHATVIPPEPKVECDEQPKAAESADQASEACKVNDNEDQKIVNAIADLFSIAALSMKAGVTAAISQVHLDAAKDKLKEQKSISKVSKDSLKIAKKLSKESMKQFRSVVKSGTAVKIAHVPIGQQPLDSTTATKQESSGININVDGSKVTPDVKKVETTKESISKETVDTKSDIPFIHGRHTCDQCLTTPVIGKRYHALNLPDYDLCESCFSNYKGTDIVFEDVKLDRDVPFQDRWNRKKAMYEAALKGHMCHRRQWHKHRSCGHPIPQTQLNDPCPQPTSETTAVAPINGTVSLNDPALEEAIRRSLDDVSQTLDDGKEGAVTTVTDETTTEVDVKNIVVQGNAIGENIKDLVREPDIELDAIISNDVKESSYASEAKGSGDVATFVGETLDRLSEAIDDLNNEITHKGDLVFETNDTNFDDHSGIYTTEDDNSGSKIVDGEEDNCSIGSWSVVVEKNHEVVTEDEGLGRAAEAIGSALFQSDMLRSTEDTSSSRLSSIASVPTVVPSIVATEIEVPQIQLERWSVQLEQLRELGFDNVAACVETLEALAAANIGVDADDEVTVQQVVARLMGD